LSPAHPSTSIRALAFLGSRALAAWTQDLAGELAVSRAGSGARPGTGRTPRPGGDIPARILRSLQCLASPPSGHSYRCSYGHPRIDFNRRCIGVLEGLHYQSNISLCVPQSTFVSVPILKSQPLKVPFSRLNCPLCCITLMNVAEAISSTSASEALKWQS